MPTIKHIPFIEGAFQPSEKQKSGFPAKFFPTAEKLLVLIGKRYECLPETMLARSRKQGIVIPRALFVLTMNRIFGDKVKLKTLGMLFPSETRGKARDHSCIIRMLELGIRHCEESRENLVEGNRILRKVYTKKGASLLDGKKYSKNGIYREHKVHRTDFTDFLEKQWPQGSKKSAAQIQKVVSLFFTRQERKAE